MNSKRRRAGVAIVIALAAAIPAVTAPAGQAAKRKPTCNRAHSKTVAKNRTVRVFTVKRKGTTTLYACRRSTGRRAKLTKSFDGFTSSAKFSDVRLRGNFVAYAYSATDQSCKADCPPDFEPTKTSIRVYNVRKHRSRTVDGYPVGKALVLSSRGGVAWASRSGTSGPVEIRGSVRSGDNRLFDSGNIDPKSLAIEITIISWKRDGTEYFARLR
jgi:hypothetical protein